MSLSSSPISPLSRGRTLQPTPRPEPLAPQSLQRPASIASRSSSRQSRFRVEGFESDPARPISPWERQFASNNEEKDLQVPNSADLWTRPLSPGRISESSLVKINEVLLQPEEEAKAPRWPAILRIALRVVSILAASLIIALNVHSISIYNATKLRNISGSGDEGGFTAAWPADITLRPAHGLIILASLSVFGSILALIAALRQKFSEPLTSRDGSAIGFGVFIWVGWLGGVIAFNVLQSNEQSDSLMTWACKSQGSVSDLVVNYGGVCVEQNVAMYIGAAVIGVETMILSCYVVTHVLWKKEAKKLAAQQNRHAFDWS